MSKSQRFTFVVLFALVLALVTFAYAAANTVPVTGAGDGNKEISGYEVTNVHYVLNADPSKVDSVQFSLTPLIAGASTTPTSVKAAIDSTWADSCSLASSTYTCTFATPVSVLTAANLRIVAAQ